MKYAGVILFLVGFVIGIMVSPKGERMIGSNNGNNNGNDNGNNNSGCLTEDMNSKEE